MAQVNPSPDVARRLIQSISQSVIGKPEAIELVVTGFLAGSHVLLEDLPGTGKTLLAKSLARSFSGEFKRVQFTSDIMPSDITGNSIFNMKSGEFEFIPGPIFANIILADEINRATPRSQSSLLEVMEENQVTVDGITHRLDKPFFVIATQNPLESYGTFPLPESQLDRFVLSFSMGYPGIEDESQILQLHLKNTRDHQSRSLHDQLKPVASIDEILTAQQELSKVTLSDEVHRFLVALIRRTRTDERILLGASTRAAVSFLRAAQAYAYLQARSYVSPDDLKYLAPFVLSHRLTLRQSGSRADKTTLIQDLADQVFKEFA